MCNGRGEPIDGGPPDLRRKESAAVTGVAHQPGDRRATRRDPIVTGISVIDGLATLVRGQKLPVFSVGGLPHLELASQIAVQAHAGEESFRIVFCAMGVTHADAEAVRDVLEARAENGEIALFLNTADDPVIERILCPRVALTVAESLAFGAGHHVLAILADMTSYCEAVREVSAARGEIPARRGYPGFLYSDLASLYERSGRLRREARVAHAAPGAHHAGGRPDAPGARPHGLHHRGAGGAHRRAGRARASTRRWTCCSRSRASCGSGSGRSGPGTTTCRWPTSSTPRSRAPGRRAS